MKPQDKVLRAEESYPLSPMQQGMLYHGLQDQHAGVDIEQILCSFDEELDVPCFKRAWEQIVDRHPILRTSFRWEDVPQPLQVVHSGVRLPWDEEDWRSRPEAEQAAGIQAVLARERAAGFDLAQAPLMRFRLIRKGDSNYWFLWTFHHALLDGRSFPILFQEVFAAYEAARRGDPAPAAEPRPYREYIDWLQRQDFDPFTGAWREKLKGFSTPTPLAVDRLTGREAVPAPDYHEQELRISSVQTSVLKSFAQLHEITVNTLLQGAWAILLSRYSGEEDVVFGATRACRATGLEESGSRVGLFINTLPMRTRVDPEQVVLDGLEKLRSQWIEMREAEHTPLIKIMSAGEMAPGQPLFESIVVFENFLLDSRLRAEGGAWRQRHFHYYGQTNYPITVMGYLDEELILRIGYYRHRFQDDAVERMLSHLETLLREIVEKPHARIRELGLLTGAERHQLLVEWNRTTEFPAPTCLHQWYEEQVRRAPDAPALTYEDQNLTYAELNMRANQLANLLREAGVKPDDLVGLCLDRSPDLVIAILGILKAGGAYLPLDPAYPPDRQAFMLEDAGVSVLLTQESLKAKAPVRPGLRIVCLDTQRAEIEGQDSGNLDVRVRPENLAYVIYTSGSTGTPKGVLVTHANVVRLFHATEPWFHFNRDDVWTLFHSSAFDFSVWEIWGALLYGGRLVVVPYLVSRSPDAFYELLRREKVTVLNQTPSAFHQLIQVDESAANRNDLALRYAIFGGEALELQSLRPWFERHGDEHPQLINMYGITETTVHVTYRPLASRDLTGAPGSVIGVPIPDVELYILDRQLNPVPIGVAGEIYVGGAGVSCGYLKRDQLTAERFIPHPFRPGKNARLYKTGDLGRYLPGRDIEYLGRADDQVKIRGFRIELGEIESVLCRHPDVQKAVVLARQEVSTGKRLIAYLVTRPERSPSVGDLREWLKQKLPEYMVPSAFVKLDQLPLTPNGKIDRKALPEPEAERPDLKTAFAAPGSPMETTLARIWSDVLRVENVGIHDNFFELGGDSILTIQIVARARRAGLLLKPQQLFKHPTIAELARVAAAGQAAARTVDGELGEGNALLTPIQHWFFEQNLAGLHHWNQAFLFIVPKKFEPTILERAVSELIRHHDALRFRYTRGDAGWEQAYSQPDESVPFELKRMAHLSETEQLAGIELVSAKAQTELDIESGPLLRIIYFDLGSGCADRLLMVIHHLVVDGVSWSILIEDLERTYDQLRSQQPVQLPARTTSYKVWAQRLNEFAQSNELRSEVEYWRQVTSSGSPTLGADSDRRLLNTEGSAHVVEVALSELETYALLQQVPAAYNTQINDVLLTALAEALTRWSGADSVRLDVEGHGREDLFEGVDLSRTVGWFTSIFPVVLKVNRGSTVGQRLTRVKELLRAIPRRGLGYGLLKYLCRDPEVKQSFRDDRPAEVLFNYLGRFDSILPGSGRLKFAEESPGPWRHPQAARRYLIEIDGLVMNSQLKFAWKYSDRVHQRETIEKAAREFLESLRELIRHCMSPAAGGRSPADFPSAGLDQNSLDRLLSEYSEVEDIYPLTSMQELFYSMGAAAGHELWHCTLQGPLDRTAYRQAWNDVVMRHSMLRTAFASEGMTRPLQVVCSRVELPWREEDYRSLTPSQQADRINGLIREERARAFDLARAPVMRMTLAQTRDDIFQIIWCSHHLVVDGWSWPLILKEVTELYSARLSGRPPTLEPARPFRDHVAWLQAQRGEDDEAFWRNQLRGKSAPTRLATPRRSADSQAEPEPFAEQSRTLEPVLTGKLVEWARVSRVTLNTVVQAAWALLLSRRSGEDDVLLGVTFSGRPDELDGVESMVGSFVNNVPLRIRLVPAQTSADWLRDLAQQIAAVGAHQHTPLARIQEWSEIPARFRLFESLFVFQNVQVDEQAYQIPQGIKLNVISAPEITNYPLTAVVMPGRELALKIKFDSRWFDAQTVSRLLEGWVLLLGAMMEQPGAAVLDLRNRLSGLVQPIPQAPGETSVPPTRTGYVAAQSEMERSIATVWQQGFGADKIGAEDNFFELGGHSVLLVHLHGNLQKVLQRNIPLVKMFQYPTIRQLARFLSQSEEQAPTLAGMEARAQLQRSALARQKQRVKRK